MIRRVLLLASLFVTSSALATWHPSFSSNREVLMVGETRTIFLRAMWTGFTPEPFLGWKCSSDNPHIAFVEGGLQPGQGLGEVTITGISPGYAGLYVGNANATGRFSNLSVELIVLPAPVTVSIVPPASAAIVGRPVTLTAIAEGSPEVYRWYRGRLGDTSQPLQGSGNTVTVTPAEPGPAYFWVSAIAPHGTNRAEIAIDVKPVPRRRAAGH
jgi:hypothetical protein